MNQLPKLQPIPILLVTYNRIGFLKKTIDSIAERTLYPHYLFVIDNHSTDGTEGYLKSAKVRGKIFDYLILDENIGQTKALNKIFEYMQGWQQKRPMDDFVVTTNDDLIPPKLNPCWLEQMLDIFKRNEEDGLGALAMRIQRTARAEIDENKDVMYWNKGVPSVFRLMRRSDLGQLGDRPFGRLMKWDSNSVADKFKFFVKKRYGLATHLYADHIGWCENKGFGKGVETLTVAENKVGEHLHKPYSDIDPETNVPIKTNHPCDDLEQGLRNEAKNPPELTVVVMARDRESFVSSSVSTYLSGIEWNKGCKYIKIINNGQVGSDEYCMIKDIEKVLTYWKSKK